MNLLRCCTLVPSIVVSLPIFVASAGAAEQPKDIDFSTAKFDHPTSITNAWLPLKPGTRFTWDGTAVDDEGDEETHSTVCTVTDITKEIAGVRTLVCWEKDIADGELEESEIVFYAQDNDGNLWLLGEYPEEYEDGQYKATSCWIHGVKDGKAGIIMPAHPNLGDPSFSEGWAPSVSYTDRGEVYKVGEKTTVPVGSYDNVMIVDESNQETPGAHHLKFYAQGVGVVRVGWRGLKTDQESMELVKLEQISADELAKAREEVLKLERSGYEHDKDVFGKTKPIEHSSPSGVAQ